MRCLEQSMQVGQSNQRTINAEAKMIKSSFVFSENFEKLKLFYTV